MKYHVLSILLFFVAVPLFAQDTAVQSSKWFITRSGDLAAVSFSNVSRNNSVLNNVPRFTMLLNSGTHINYAISDHATVFSGITAKNMGLIYDDNDSVRFKRRVIMAGIPFGVKFGNLEKGTYLYFGGEADFALNYKEKRFLNDQKVEKKNTWFGRQTPVFMPSFFAGFVVQNMGLQLHYFPQNFFNPEFEENGLRPFAGMESQLFFISFRVDLNPPRRNFLF